MLLATCTHLFNLLLHSPFKRVFMKAKLSKMIKVAEQNIALYILFLWIKRDMLPKRARRKVEKIFEILNSE